MYNITYLEIFSLFNILLRSINSNTNLSSNWYKIEGIRNSLLIRRFIIN